MKSVLYVALALALLIVGFTDVSLADHHHHHGCSEMHMSHLSELDTDNDGLLSLDEFSKRPMEKYRGWFEMLDTNDDGSLSQKEWEAFRKEHGAENSEG